MSIPIEMNISAGEIESPYGKLLFNFDDGQFAIMGIDISKRKRRQGIGTALVRAAEKLARELGCAEIDVPATPSRMAVSFWLRMGFRCWLKEENRLVTRILESQSDDSIFDSNSGVIVMRKHLAGSYPA